MGNKCKVKGCKTNYQKHNCGAVFKLPGNPEIKQRWIKFLNRKDINDLRSVFICEKHFEEKYLKRNQTRTRLDMSMLPVPTLQSRDDGCGSVSTPLNFKLRKPPTERAFQQDELDQFKNQDSITVFAETNKSLL